MPVSAELYQAARQLAVAIPLAGRTHIEILGRDRASFLHNFCTNQIKALPVGTGCEAFVPNIKGRILFHVAVFAGEDRLWLEAVPEVATALLTHLDRYLISEDVQLVDRTNDWIQIYISGDQATDRLATQVGAELSTLAEGGQMSLPEVGLLRRWSYGLVPGDSLVIPQDQADRWMSTLAQAGIISGPPELFELLRIEAGYPHAGIDITEEHLAQEASRTRRAISFTKGCYLGQEPIARLDALGHVNRAFAGVETILPADLPVGTELFATAEAPAAMGQLTSVAVHPITGHTLGLGVFKKVVLVDGGPCFLGPDRIPARVKVWEAPH